MAGTSNRRPPARARLLASANGQQPASQHAHGRRSRRLLSSCRTRRPQLSCQTLDTAQTAEPSSPPLPPPSLPPPTPPSTIERRNCASSQPLFPRADRPSDPVTDTRQPKRP
jgi:hypothetical protein